jgi:hypothetical protein
MQFYDFDELRRNMPQPTIRGGGGYDDRAVLDRARELAREFDPGLQAGGAGWMYEPGEQFMTASGRVPGGGWRFGGQIVGTPGRYLPVQPNPQADARGTALKLALDEANKRAERDLEGQRLDVQRQALGGEDRRAIAQYQQQNPTASGQQIANQAKRQALAEKIASATKIGDQAGLAQATESLNKLDQQTATEAQPFDFKALFAKALGAEAKMTTEDRFINSKLDVGQLLEGLRGNERLKSQLAEVARKLTSETDLGRDALTKSLETEFIRRAGELNPYTHLNDPRYSAPINLGGLTLQRQKHNIPIVGDWPQYQVSSPSGAGRTFRPGAEALLPGGNPFVDATPTFRAETKARYKEEGETLGALLNALYSMQ